MRIIHPGGFIGVPQRGFPVRAAVDGGAERSSYVARPRSGLRRSSSSLTPVTSTRRSRASAGSASSSGSLAALGLIALERRLQAVPGHHMVGALVGGVIGLFGARLVWGALDGLDIVGEHFVHALVVVFLGYMGVVIGGQKGEWFEPARMIAAFRDSSPPAPVQGARHLGDHRRPHRRHLRDGLPGGHAGGAAVRAARAAAGGRLLGLAEAQPRPARPRHPAEDAEDGRRRTCRSWRRTSRRSARWT